jgi:hypothetical protein
LRRPLLEIPILSVRPAFLSVEHFILLQSAIEEIAEIYDGTDEPTED